VGAPYVSQRRLVDNSVAAMLGAIEMYNKPQMTYRDEVTVILIVNAWELALKAVLVQEKQSIHYKKERGKPYRSISIDDALNRMSGRALWPDGIDGAAITANVRALTEFRDRAVHLYNATGLGAVIYPFLQQNVLNYRDLMVNRFHKDIAEAITWQLLPLGATAPGDAVRFMKVDASTAVISEVQQFIDELRNLMDAVEAGGNDTTRVATIYDINMQSVKKMSSADLVVAIASEGEHQVIVRPMDPNNTHPYGATELLRRVNGKRTGREITTYDHQAVCWQNDLRNEKKYAWRHSNSAAHVWSGDAVSYLATLTDESYDDARDAYSAHLTTERAKNKQTKGTRRR
jgi:hypothetical protein